jgi:molybdenum cofactor cytidylyltransferase
LLAFYLLQPEKIAALAHNGVRGNPCVFPAAFFPALLALQGDVGGGAVIKDHSDALRLMEVPLSQLQDIDTVQQLDILRE